MVLGITPSTKFVYSLSCRTLVRQPQTYLWYLKSHGGERWDLESREEEAEK